jgi:hypothetical protein
MVTPAGLLSSSALRNLSAIQGGVARGLSSTAIQTLIRETTGTGVRRVDLLEAIRSVRGIAESGLRVQNIRKDRFPDPARMERAKTRILSNYSFTTEVSGVNRFTGVKETSHLTVRSNRLLTPNEIISEAKEAVAQAQVDTPSDLPFQVSEIKVVGARRR